MIYIKGTVEYGTQEASKLGFPTLNIHCSINIFTTGIFYGITKINENIYNSVIYIGNNRTNNNITYQCIESHLIDITNVNYYNNQCEIQIIYKIRDNHDFIDINNLKQEIQNDIQKCKNISLQRTINKDFTL